MNDMHRAAFLEESTELLAELELALLELEATPDNGEAVGRVFRALHTIKGSGAMFGFDAVADFTHEVETTFDLVREGRMLVDRDLVNLTLNARDHIRELLAAEAPDAPALAVRTENLSSAFKMFMEKNGTDQVRSISKQSKATYRIRFAPSKDVLLAGCNPILLLKELKELGECRIVAQTCDIPSLEELDPEQCYLYWDIVLTTDAGLNAIRGVFIFVEDRSNLRIDVIDDGSHGDDTDETRRRVGEILTERGDVTQEEIEEVLAERKLLGEMLVEKGLVSPDKVLSALEEIKHMEEVTREKKKREMVSSIRVPAEKLDRLVDNIGELVTLQARLSQTVKLRDFDQLTAIAEEIERLTAELRDSSLTMRMLPIGTTFSNFKRIIRDLSAEMGKEIRMVTEGGDTELDKTILEKLHDPLVHIIRNSIDHGLEDPAARIAVGKPRQGTIRLSAFHSGDSVIIRISDDGQGLDRQAILERAVEKGLVPAGVEIPDRQLYQVIFSAGFSTAKEVTGLSGRGVGMDVVKRAVESMRGSIDIQSVPGRGTTFAIRLPLTLAIIESLLVRIGQQRFILPLSFVKECIAIDSSQVDNANGMCLTRVRGSLVPYIHMRDLFRINDATPEIQQVVIGMVDDLQVGFLVDQVIGEHQSVIKALGRMYRSIDSISGATILGDGTVALILNVESLVRDELAKHSLVAAAAENQAGEAASFQE